LSEFFDYNQSNGMKYDTEMDGDDLIIRATQDVEPTLDHMTKKRNSDNSDMGIKRGMWHYCTIPVHVELELRAKGINIYNKHQTKKLIKEINTNYKYLKATRLNHEIP